MAEQITGGDPNALPQGQSTAYPVAQDAQDPTPVQNIPPSAVPPGLHTAPHPDQLRTTTLKVHGEDVVVDQARLVELAQKGMAADANFKTASDKTKEAESALTLQEDLRLLTETGDINAFRRAGAALGLSGEQVEEAAQIVYESMGEGSEYDEGSLDRNENDIWKADDARRGREQGAGQGRGSGDLARELQEIKARLDNPQVSFDNLSPDLQDVLTDSEQVRIEKIVQVALDNDEFLSYYMTSYDAKGQAAIRGMIDDKIRGRLDASDGRFGDGAQILKEILPDVKELLEAIGTPNRSTPQMGLGPAPGGQGTGVHPTKEPDHVPSTDPAFEEHITQVMAHNIHKGAGS